MKIIKRFIFWLPAIYSAIVIFNLLSLDDENIVLFFASPIGWIIEQHWFVINFTHPSNIPGVLIVGLSFVCWLAIGLLLDRTFYHSTKNVLKLWLTIIGVGIFIFVYFFFTGHGDLCGLAIGKSKDQCYYAQAFKRTDSMICNKINGNDDRNGCLAKMKLDVSYCANILYGVQSDGCYEQIAIDRNDISLCPNNQSKETCVRHVQTSNTKGD